MSRSFGTNLSLAETPLYNGVAQPGLGFHKKDAVMILERYGLRYSCSSARAVDCCTLLSGSGISFIMFTLSL